MTKTFATLALLPLLAACTSPASTLDERTLTEPPAAMTEAMPSTDAQKMMSPDAMMEKAPADTMMNDTPAAAPSSTPTSAVTSPLAYEAYSSATRAAHAGQRVALFFHAPWCPSCRALDSAISTETATLAGATILKVDYDSATDLKKTYGVTSQHTLVFLNADGSFASKKLGASTADIVAFFAK